MHSPVQDQRTGIRVSHSDRHSPTLLVLVLAFVVISDAAEDVPHHSCAAVGDMPGADCLLSFEEADHEQLCKQKASNLDETCKQQNSRGACKDAKADHSAMCEHGGKGFDYLDKIESKGAVDPASLVQLASGPTTAATQALFNNCRDPSIPAPPIYIGKYSGFRCSGGTWHADAGDKQACAEAAVAANHTFISFNSAGSACESTTDCSFRTEADGWSVHKQWLGAFNATHADEVPACVDGPSNQKWRCATQVKRNGESKHDSCTSCKPGNVFQLKRGASRTGRCSRYLTGVKVLCANPYSDDELDASTPGQATVCTKWMEAQSLLRVDNMKDEGARAHYASVMGKWGYAVPKCEVRKETVCDADGSCDVRKNVKCVQVCRFLKTFPINPPYNVDNCDATLCEGEYGSLACKVAAMME